MWSEIEADWGTYYEARVRMGAATLWLTAEKRGWHIEMGDGYTLASGRARSVRESQTKAIKAAEAIFQGAQTTLRVLEIKPTSKRSGVKKKA